ncbi:MAG TPA: glycoside hydrolase domain-containing protein [Phycisphaerae bacterium]|nr:glycoside hydrolase domain-containing protein [Phycisphaerae bacterium]
MRVRWPAATWVLGVVVLAACPAAAEPNAAPAVVLDTFGFWRIHQTFRPPVCETDAGVQPYVQGPAWLNQHTAPPPAGWTTPDFDDGGWLRGAVGTSGPTPYLARLCLRGKFEVTDPAKVKDLSLSMDYHGGVIVYVNGTELTRAHLPAGPVEDKTLAASYPLDVYVTKDGDLLAVESTYTSSRGRLGRPDADSVRRMAQRDRKLDRLAIPSRLLRKGVNVLAIAIVRSPYHKVVLEEEKVVNKRRANRFDWSTCRVVRAQLVAATAGQGVTPNASRPQGVQVWNSDPLASDTSMDYGDPTEPLRPIRLIGARNGCISGKVVVGSTAPIDGLRAAPSALRGPGGTIPTSAVRIRYAMPWGREGGVNLPAGPVLPPYRHWPALISALAEALPGPVTPPKLDTGRPAPGQLVPKAVAGAVVPVWVTVKVPADARPGKHTGQITISVGGARPVTVPVELTVIDFALPDPQDYRTWVELMQSPDTLAMEYKAKPWSAEHWKLIAESLRLLNGIGSRVLYVPLLAHTNLGNDESMVRWIAKGGNQFDHDFSTMDKYLDLAAQNMGTPKIVVFNVWDVYLVPKTNARASGRRMVDYMNSKGQPYGFGPLVTTLDPATGKTDNAYLPRYEELISKSLWKPLLDDIRKRMQKRGLEGAMMLGMTTDAVPTKQDVQFFAELAPGAPWVQHGHGGYEPNKPLHGIAPIGYQACVWHTQFVNSVKTHGRNWGSEPLYGWRQKQLTAAFERNTVVYTHPPTRWRHMGETNISGGQRGMGRLGADFWDVIKDKQGRRRGNISARYPESQWMNLNICNPVLAPGPNGPVATTRYEALREGIQECEARIFIERALLDEKLKARLGAELATRCKAELDERIQTMWFSLSNMQLGGTMFFRATDWRWTPCVAGHRWFVASGWQERSRRLYQLAAEVAAKTGSR